MNPIIILPPDVMTDEHIKLLRENNLCVVVATDPAKVKFIDPIPAASSRTDIENAAIKLSRRVLNPGFWSSESTRDLMARAYVEILVKGTPLSQDGTKEEQEQRYFDQEKLAELQRLAKEEARRERAAKKLEAAKTKK